MSARGNRWTEDQLAMYQSGKRLALPERMTPQEARAADTPEGMLAAQLDAQGIAYQSQYEFHPERGWRFDFMLDPIAQIALEINGGNWARGAHVRPKQLAQNEYPKLSEAAILGWRVLIVTPEDVVSGRALVLVKRALGQ